MFASLTVLPIHYINHFFGFSAEFVAGGKGNCIIPGREKYRLFEYALFCNRDNEPVHADFFYVLRDSADYYELL